jgi:hypothetical protein
MPEFLKSPRNPSDAKVDKTDLSRPAVRNLCYATESLPRAERKKAARVHARTALKGL